MSQAKGTAVALTSAFGLLFFCSILINAAVLPEKTADVCVAACCLAGVLAGGSLAVRRGSGRHTAFRGFGVGVTMTAILTVSGFLLYSSMDILWCAVLFGACLLGGGVASLSGVKRSGRRQR